jgi:hypothetical protein
VPRSDLSAAANATAKPEIEKAEPKRNQTVVIAVAAMAGLVGLYLIITNLLGQSGVRAEGPADPAAAVADGTPASDGKAAAMKSAAAAAAGGPGAPGAGSTPANSNLIHTTPLEGNPNARTVPAAGGK